MHCLFGGCMCISDKYCESMADGDASMLLKILKFTSMWMLQSTTSFVL